MKTSLLAFTLFATGASVVTGSAFADDGRSPSTEVPRVPGQMSARQQPGGDGIAVNGRCGGVSFGMGASRCGDSTGGPSGGISSRN